MCLLPVSAGFNQAFVEHESRLLGSNDLLYDPYDDGMAPLRPERVNINPDGTSTEFTEPYEPPGMLCQGSASRSRLQNRLGY